jgi:hypothetical protein
MRELGVLLEDEYGLNRADRPGEDQMQQLYPYAAIGISADGLTIAGGGRNIFGQGEGWIAHLDHPLIPEPSTLGLLATGAAVLTLVSLRRRGTCGPHGVETLRETGQ